MSAGTGIDHSEMNPSRDEPVHFLQIWILPERVGLPPGYEQRTAAIAERKGELVRVASRDGREGSITIHQDVSVWAARLAAGDRVEHFFAAGRHAWLQVARGAVAANGLRLAAGDGLAASEEPHLVIEAEAEAEVLLFDLAS